MEWAFNVLYICKCGCQREEQRRVIDIPPYSAERCNACGEWVYGTVIIGEVMPLECKGKESDNNK